MLWLGQHRGLEIDNYDDLWRWSVDELESFWDAVWHFYGVESTAPFRQALADRRMPGARWFEGAQLNYAQALLDRAAAASASVVHLREGGSAAELSVADLRTRVGALAATLRNLGVGRGDRVAAYISNVPEAIIGLLATASLGAIWSACAPDFATPSVVDRFEQLEPKVLLAMDSYRFNGREHDRRETIVALLARLSSLQATIVVRALDPERSLPPLPGTLTFEQACADRQEPAFTQVPVDHPLWILFSSGTTGLPKGIVQSHGGILLEHLKSLGLCLDLQPADRYLFFSSTSWMAWNYLVGGLLHGATVVLYDGSPTHGGQDRLWRVAAETGTSVLGMGSAYAAACQKGDVRLRDEMDLSAMRTVVPTGSPLSPAGWRWLSDELGSSVRIDSICGGTDVCTAFFGGSELLPVYVGEASCRWLGISAKAFDADGHELVDSVGEFVVTEPMPSMPTGLWRDPDGRRYRAAYFEDFPGVWRQGDWITITSRGSVCVWGRSDATLNRGGVRIGSAEIYAAVETLPEINDSLVVGLELSDGDYYMPLFVVGDVEPGPALDAAIADAIRATLSPRHVPDEVIVVPVVPRTLTGKKLEVPVKRILQGGAPEDAAALGSVDRPDALHWFADFAAGHARLVATRR